MEILSYLAELVKTHKEIGITGLGTFFKKKLPGKYDAENHSFVPPSYQLKFIEEVREAGILTEFISKKRNISYDSAVYFVEQFVEELQTQLKENREADLGELGKLSAAEDEIAFVPSGNFNYGFEFYGLPSLKDEGSLAERDFAQQQEAHFHDRLDLEDHNADLGNGTAESDEQPVYEEISEIQAQHEPPAAESVLIETEGDLDKTPEEVPGIPQIGEPIAETEAVAETGSMPEAIVQQEGIKADQYSYSSNEHSPGPDDPADIVEAIEDTDRKTPAYVYLIITFLILAVAGIALYFIKPELFGRKENQMTPAVQKHNSAVIDSAVRTDSLVNTAQIDTNAGDSSKYREAAINPIAVTDTTTTWEVIGATVVKKEVNQVLADMKAAGITGKVIPTMPGKRRIKISIATFYDEATARAGRRKLAVKLKNPDLYIYQNKHTHKPE